MAEQTTPTTNTATALSTSEQALLAAWQERVRTGTFSSGVEGTRTIKVMGRAGDAPVAIPRITDLAVLDNISPEERFALEYGDRLVSGFLGRGRRAFEEGEMIERFNQTGKADILILSPIAGG